MMQICHRLLSQTLRTCPRLVVCSHHHIHTGRVFQAKTPETELAKILKARIKMNGPITVADYMRDVLTNPDAGYYMHKDVFGVKGDFITSPEISQMFGELLGMWGVFEWIQSGCPHPWQVVELGPGRGTLADDMMRAFKMVFPKMKDFIPSISYHMVEVSPTLSKMQYDRLASEEDKSKQGAGEISEESEAGYYRHCQSKHGPQVYWYDSLKKVPKGFTYFLAHEFFDALPIHKFQLRHETWHEVLVDVDNSPDGDHFRYVLSREPTPASELLLEIPKNNQRDHIEVCPEGGVLVEEIARRLDESGGYALIADYGHSGEKGHSFRAFKDHSLFEPLQEPGTADLTADVDFSYLRAKAGDKVICHGPIFQGTFLENMGIKLRMKRVLETNPVERTEPIIEDYQTLVYPEKMGKSFKYFAMNKLETFNHAPDGFFKREKDRPLDFHLSRR